MSEPEVSELLKMSYDEAKQQTLKELTDYQEDVETIGLAAVIDRINEEIDACASYEENVNKRKRKRK